MRYIGAHSHIQMKEFDRDRDAVLSRMKDDGVGAIVVGVDLESSREAVALAEAHDFLWATVGLHPHDNLKEVFDADAYRALAAHPKVVAIGECGLDYSRVTNHVTQVKEKQKERFERQLDLAAELNKPLMLHIRDKAGEMGAYEEVLDILNSNFSSEGGSASGGQFPNSKPRGNVHFFAGNQDIAQKF